MSRPKASVLVAVLHAGVLDAGEPPVELADSLFSKIPAAALSTPDRRAIAAQTPLTLQGERIVSKRRGCDRDAMDPNVRLADLNGDGPPEVFIVAGNTCTSGMTGTSVWLFARQRDGVWVQLMDVVAVEYRVLPSTTHGWRDIGLETRTSSCMGIWHLNGDGRYRYARSVAADGSPCSER